MKKIICAFNKQRQNRVVIILYQVNKANERNIKLNQHR